MSKKVEIIDNSILRKTVIRLGHKVHKLSEQLRRSEEKRENYQNWRRKKIFVKPYWYTIDEIECERLLCPLIYSFPVPERHQNPKQVFQRRGHVSITAEADFEVDSILCVGYTEKYERNDLFAISMRDCGNDCHSNNLPILQLAIGKTEGGIIYPLAESLFLGRASIWEVEFTSVKPERLYVYFALIGRKYYYPYTDYPAYQKRIAKEKL